MPRENKPRGRREKRKRQEAEAEEPSKRPRTLEANIGAEAHQKVSFIGLDDSIAAHAQVTDAEPAAFGSDRPFYGLLDDDEQEYFRQVDEFLEDDQFETDDERRAYLAGVYQNAEGKELKLANSQSCSRLMEKLILLSTVEQKKKLFEVFSGNFPHLIQHRFASHCCETLFIHSATVVTQELTGDIQIEGAGDDGDSEKVYVSMENLFLYTLNELEGQMNFLLTDRFASHALRVLLIVLSGLPLSKTSTKSLLQSRKKEHVSVTGYKAIELSTSARAVPESFHFAVQKIISDTVAGLDTAFIRVLATHPTGNPTLQLLLELELTQQGKSKGAALSEHSIIGKLLPDDMSVEGSESSIFINGLVYEQIGSRLLETIVTFAPGKLFKQIYKTTFKERIGALARNEIASFVVVKVLERLSKDDLEEAVTLILPQIANLCERNRTTILKTLFDRCQARKSYKSVTALTQAVAEGYGSDLTTLVTKMALFTESIASAVETDPPVPRRAQPDVKPTPEALHGSLLAQTMLNISHPPEPSELIQTSLLALPASTLLAMSLTITTSHILQTALVPTTTNLPFRRKLVNAILSAPSGGQSSPIMALALSKPGSHTLDALFIGTSGLMQLKERICADLVAHEQVLRNDVTGRLVWRNWMGELFRRRRTEWIAKVKAGEGGAGSGAAVGAEKLNGLQGSGSGQVINGPSTTAQASHQDSRSRQEHKSAGSARHKEQNGRDKNPGGSRSNGRVGVSGKTALQLAREKFAAQKATGGSNIQAGRPFKPTGANAGIVVSR